MGKVSASPFPFLFSPKKGVRELKNKGRLRWKRNWKRHLPFSREGCLVLVWKGCYLPVICLCSPPWSAAVTPADNHHQVPELPTWVSDWFFTSSSCSCQPGPCKRLQAGKAEGTKMILKTAPLCFVLLDWIYWHISLCFLRGLLEILVQLLESRGIFNLLPFPLLLHGKKFL